MILEQYFGCECSCLNHISRMGYFPPEEGERVDEEYDVIYFTVKTDYLYQNVMPPIDPRDLDYYFRFHILRRIPIAVRYLFNPSYNRKHGVLDCFDFQGKDLLKMKEFLSHLTDEETEEIILDKEDLIGYVEKVIDKYVFYLNNERWRLAFTIWRIDKDIDWWLGWEIQFIPRKIFSRIKYALKYIFGKVSDEQEFEINEEIAKKIKGIITVVEKLNNERTKSKN